LAFDGDRFKVFASPHVLKNLFRVLTKAGLSESLVKRALQDASDIVHFSGGSILEPLREAVYQKDHEDNLILDLTLASGSEVIVTLNQEFQSASGFKGIAIIPPKQFLNFAIRVQPD
jgi:predicted nucleic acid-binding protein